MRERIGTIGRNGKAGSHASLAIGLVLAALLASLAFATPAQALSTGDTFTVSGNKYKVTDVDYDPGCCNLNGKACSKLEQPCRFGTGMDG